MRIHINYSVLTKNGNDYNKYNTELQAIIDTLKIRSENILNNWISANSTSFNTLMKHYIDDLQVDANRMKRHANILLGINDDFKEKDLEYQKYFEPEETISQISEEDIYGDR